MWSHLRQKDLFPRVWSELVSCILVGGLCCHKPLMSTDCQATSLCGAIAYDVEEVSLTYLEAEHLVHLEA